MSREEIEGKAQKAKGYVKDKTGEIFDDPELEAEGEIERAPGTVREGLGRAKRQVQEDIEDIAKEAEE